MEESEEDETLKSKNSRKAKKKPTRRPKLEDSDSNFEAEEDKELEHDSESSSSEDEPEPRARSKAKPKGKATSKGTKGAKGKRTPGTSREDELATMLKTIVSKYGSSPPTSNTTPSAYSSPVQRKSAPLATRPLDSSVPASPSCKIINNQTRLLCTYR
uniref:Uncharacterized protein n=1 Tax=Proboscia inermis TaxID=420281 RepID=A0A7S0GAU0_9STRA|mmetsp:Transcript_27137/g.27534  ORF Transcript_27137/g.27534 Transcript_27137/m.27534 type:complete len:158 (+) Transcript_27137:532-1005(+)